MKKIFSFFAIFFIVINSHSQIDSISKIDDYIMHTVVNIQKGKETGTGFIVGRKNPNRYQFFLVTNKHMIGDYNFIDPFLIDSIIHVSFYTNDSKSRQIKISLKDSMGAINSIVKFHPLHTVDIAVIDVSKYVVAIPNWRPSAVDTSYLVQLSNISYSTKLGLGSQVFALGYPGGLYIESSNQPIAKAGYIASSINGLLKIKTSFTDRKGRNQIILPEGKYFLVDGLIIRGNSGGPIVSPQGQMIKVLDDQIQYTQTIPNLFLGIVSFSLGNTGICVIYSCDNIREIIDSFPII